MANGQSYEAINALLDRVYAAPPELAARLREMAKRLRGPQYGIRGQWANDGDEAAEALTAANAKLAEVVIGPAAG